MSAEGARAVLAALGDALPVFALGLLALSALLLLVLFGRSGPHRRLQQRAQRTLTHMRRRIHGLPNPADAVGLPPDPSGTAAMAHRVHPWLAMRDGLPVDIAGGVALGAAAVLALRWFGAADWVAAAVGAGLALLAPRVVRGHRRKARLRRIGTEFPAAVDTMVRGLRAGLPLIDCVRLIASEAEPGIAAEFRRTLEDYDIGVPVEQSLQRTAERLPLDEVRFFAVVVALQTQTGGRLADMLETLSDALRNRRALSEKVQIMSQEAKSSAAIIGALPLVVAGALFLVSPDYVGVLLTTRAGVVALLGAGLWMGVGVVVMRGMINFDV